MTKPLPVVGAERDTWGEKLNDYLAELSATTDAKVSSESPAFTGTPTGITKMHVGLGSVDNTADTAKPVSTAQAAALGAKVDATVAAATYTTGHVTPSGQVGGGLNVNIPGAGSDAIAADISSGVIIGGGHPGGYNNIIGGDGHLTVDTGTPNATSLGTAAHVSVVGGYDNVAGAISSKIISDHSYVGIDATVGHSAIYGGSGNVIDGTGTGYAGIFSGFNCHVSAPYGFVTGYQNVVSAIGGIAMGGASNTVSADYGLAIGTGNIASGAYSWASGASNAAIASYSEAVGSQAKARNIGQHAHAVSKLAVQGDMQGSTWVCGSKTLDGTMAVLGVGGPGGSGYKLAEAQSGTYSLMLVARDIATGNTKSWKVELSAHREVGVATPVLTAAATKTVIAAHANAATWDVIVSPQADNTLGFLITGQAGKSIVWAGYMTCVEVLG